MKPARRTDSLAGEAETEECIYQREVYRMFFIEQLKKISEVDLKALEAEMDKINVPWTQGRLADKLVEKNNLYFFAKGSKSEKFATLGNDNGLFIIVETNRKWYPTEQQAEKHYTKIKISTDGLTREITMNEENAGR